MGVTNAYKCIKRLCDNTTLEALGKFIHVNKRNEMHADTAENLTGNTTADEIHPGSHYYEIFPHLSAFTFSNLEKHLVLAANCHLTIHRFSRSF